MKAMMTGWVLLLLWTGCGNRNPASAGVIEHPEREDWFSRLLNRVDAVAGPKFQYLRMGMMEVGTYENSPASIADVVKVVEPTLVTKGFSRMGEEYLEKMKGEAEKELEREEFSMFMDMHGMMRDSVLFKHKDGSIVIITDSHMGGEAFEVDLLQIMWIDGGKVSKARG